MSNGTRRPAYIIQRDHEVAQRLLGGPRALRPLAEESALTQASTYRALYRLRTQGFVDKSRDGSRTPTWALTEAGVVYASSPLPAEPAPVAPPPPVVEAPVEVPVAPTVAPPEVPQF